MRTSLPDFAVGVGGFDGQYKTHGEEIGAGFEFITHHHTKGTSLNEGEDFLLHCGVRLCQTSWRDPAVRSHVGILGGACGLQCLPCWRCSCLQFVILVDRVPGRSTWGSPTMNKHLWTPKREQGGERTAFCALSLACTLDSAGLFTRRITCSPDGSIVHVRPVIGFVA
jgi:hypothetical protein